VSAPQAQVSAQQPQLAPGDSASRDGPRNDDDIPAVEPSRPSLPATSVVRATDSGLPSYQDAAAVPGAGIPELRLDLHAFDPSAANRFVFINMVKLREGDSLPQGVRVESITPDGAILSFRGNRFVLQR
jgi:general secretion pathway protein B